MGLVQGEAERRAAPGLERGSGRVGDAEVEGEDTLYRALEPWGGCGFLFPL